MLRFSKIVRLPTCFEIYSLSISNIWRIHYPVAGFVLWNPIDWKKVVTVQNKPGFSSAILLLLAFKALNGSGPKHISDRLLRSEPSRPPRSSGTGLLSVPRVKTKHGEAACSYFWTFLFATAFHWSIFKALSCTETFSFFSLVIWVNFPIIWKWCKIYVRGVARKSDWIKPKGHTVTSDVNSTDGEWKTVSCQEVYQVSYSSLLFSRVPRIKLRSSVAGASATPSSHAAKFKINC